MSMDTPSTSPSPIPSITGNPAVDSLIRSGLIAAAVALTTMILTWLNSKGFAKTDIVFLGQTISPSVLIGGAVFTTLVAAASAVWGWLKGTQIGQVVSDAHLVGVQAGVVLQRKAIAFAGPTEPIETAAIDPAQITHADAKAAIAALPPTTTKGTA